MTTTTTTAPDTILELSFGYVAARALHVVVEHGVADALGDEPRAADELAAGTGLDVDALDRMLRLLEERSVFRRQTDRRWAHTEASRLLREDHPRSLRGFARMTGTPFAWHSFTHLDHAARTGAAGATCLHPEGWIGYLRTHPDEGRTFQEAMTAKAHADVAAALEVHDFSRYGRICDVGGGHGHLLRAVADRHPSVHGILFDLPAVTGGLEPSEPFEVVTGDFFVDPLPEADAYVLMNIVHDWDDERSIELLGAVGEAARRSTATVLLLESLVPEGADRHWSKTLDVVMLGITGGRERSLPEYADLLTAGGLELVSATPTATPFSVLEART